MKRNIILVLSLLFISLALVGCGKKQNIDDAVNDSVNKGDSDAAVALLVENGIDLNSIKPEGTVSSVTYEEAGEKDKGVIFYIEGETNKKDLFTSMLDYFKITSSDGKLYDSKNKEYNYEKEITDKTKEQDIIYTYNNKKINVHIEYEERNCPNEVSSGKCDTYGIVFE